MGTHSFRNFDIEKQFSEEFKKCSKGPLPEKHKCEVAVRIKYREIESGRLNQMADKIHNFISHLDEDEVQEFKKKFPGMVNIANDFAVVEELREF
jgi:hypothetical protein